MRTYYFKLTIAVELRYSSLDVKNTLTTVIYNYLDPDGPYAAK